MLSLLSPARRHGNAAASRRSGAKEVDAVEGVRLCLGRAEEDIERAHDLPDHRIAAVAVEGRIEGVADPVGAEIQRLCKVLGFQGDRICAPILAESWTQRWNSSTRLCSSESFIAAICPASRTLPSRAADRNVLLSWV